MQISVKNLKDNLSACLKQVSRGEEFFITSHNHVIAKIVPLTGEDLPAKVDWSSFLKDIHQLHHRLSKVVLKNSMRDTVIKQRTQERS